MARQIYKVTIYAKADDEANGHYNVTAKDDVTARAKAVALFLKQKSWLTEKDIATCEIQLGESLDG